MFQIAIDGPSGAGKSTVAKALAARLGIVYVDTGALYRTIGYYVRSRGVSPSDARGVEALLSQIHIRVAFEEGSQHVYLNGTDLGNRIREPEISMYASTVSAIPAVRTFLLETQRQIARENSVIMDGRDIGTVILPEADLKVFLTASREARAKRRVLELAQKGIETTYAQVLEDMEKRDEQDRTRAVAPAVAAPDAVVVDNSELTFEETLQTILKLAKERIAELGD